MRKLLIVIFILPFVMIIAGCGGEDDETESGNKKECFSNNDCAVGFECNLSTYQCEQSGDSGPLPDNSDSGDDGDSGDSGDSGNSGNSGDTGTTTGDCTPDQTQKCNYQGSPITEDIGPCKAGVRTCKSDHTWGPCEGEVLPEFEVGELCTDGIDNDCDGVEDNGADIDGDGVPSCQDCCEYAKDCPDPKDAWDATMHFCSYDETENAQLYECDSSLNGATKEPMDYAKAIGLCKTATDDPSSGWGVISAEILKPDGSFGAHIDSNGVLNALGSVITPKSGNYMLALSSGKARNPFPCSSSSHCNLGVSSSAPSDWYEANGKKLPSAPSCPNGDVIRDAVMLQLKVRVPKGVKSFSFNLYFLSVEFPQFVCTQYNDFFIALLTSTHKSDNPEFQNPADKNLAMDENKYPVGVNLAKSGLFKVCPVSSTYPSCTGTAELAGSGFQNHGGTGWLTVRGNVVGGEEITLRLAIWDTGDNIWDSMVLLDNFKWEFEEYKPGTGAS